MALQASLVGEGFVTGNTVEGLALMRWLMGSQFGLLQELPASHLAFLILEGTNVFLCFRIMCFLMLLQCRTVSIVFQAGGTSVWSLLQVLGPNMVPQVLGGTVGLLASPTLQVFCRDVLKSILQATLPLTGTQILDTSLLCHF